jgi:hypothetical protein
MHFKRETVSESCIDYYSWYKHAPNLITQS